MQSPSTVPAERVSAAWSGRELDLNTPRGPRKLHWVDPFLADISEAAACGLPAVAVNAPGCAEVVHDGDTGVLTKGDPSALADRIDPRAVDASYIQTLDTLQAWIETLAPKMMRLKTSRPIWSVPSG